MFIIIIIGPGVNTWTNQILLVAIIGTKERRSLNHIFQMWPIIIHLYSNFCRNYRKNLWICCFSLYGYPCADIHKFCNVVVLHVFTSVLTKHSCSDNLHQSSGPLIWPCISWNVLAIWPTLNKGTLLRDVYLQLLWLP